MIYKMTRIQKKLNIHKDKNIVPCIAKKDIHIYVVYSRPTAGPIGLKFFVDTHGWPKGVIGYKTFDFFHSLFQGQRRASSANV